MKTYLCLIILFILSGIFTFAQDEFTEIAVFGRGDANSLSWHPSGKFLAVGGSAGVWLFDPDYNEIAFYPCSYSVTQMRFSPDGNYLAVSYSYYDDATHKYLAETEFWQFSEQGDLLNISSSIQVSGYQLQWSPDSQHISNYTVAFTTDKPEPATIEVWKIETQEKILILDDLTDVSDLAWSPDGAQLAVANDYGEIHLINSTTGKTQGSYKLSQDYIQNSDLEIAVITYMSDGQGIWFFVYGSDRLWSWRFDKDKPEPFEQVVLRTWLWSFVPQPQGEALAIQLLSGGGGDYGGIIILNSGNEPHYVRFQKDYVVDYSWIPDSTRLSVLTGNGMIREVDYLSDETQEYQRFAESGSVEWSPDSQWLAQLSGNYSSSFSYPVFAWNVNDPDIQYIKYPLQAPKWGQWSPDSQIFYIFSDNDVPHAQCLIYELIGWDIQANQDVGFWGVNICGLDGLSTNWYFEFTQDLNFVTHTSANQLSIYTAPLEGERITSFETSASINSVSWSPSETVILTTSVDWDAGKTFIETWDIESGENLTTYTTDAGWVSTPWRPQYDMFFRNDQNGSDDTLSLIDARSGDIVYSVDYAEYSWQPDGERLAIEQADPENRSLDILNGDTGELLLSIPTTQDVGFSWHPSKDWITISTGTDITIVDVETGDVIASQAITGGIGKWSPDGTKLVVYRGRRIHVWKYAPNP